jgi:hypothetical protein
MGELLADVGALVEEAIVMRDSEQRSARMRGSFRMTRASLTKFKEGKLNYNQRIA